MSENSGFSCSYYQVQVNEPMTDGTKPYLAECGDLIDALEMTPNEANIFKEIWRSCNARLGKEKEGNSQIRGAEKILFCAQRNHILKSQGKR